MKLNLKNIINLAIVALGLVAVLLFFAPAISSENGKTTHSGFHVAFGCTEKSGALAVKEFGFSFLYFLPFLLLIVAVVLACASLFVKALNNKICKIVIACLFVVAGILCFFAVQAATPWNALTDKALSGDLLKAFREHTKLGAGAIVAGILAIACGACTVVNDYLLK